MLEHRRANRCAIALYELRSPSLLAVSAHPGNDRFCKLRQSAHESAEFIHSHFCQPHPAFAAAGAASGIFFYLIDIALTGFGVGAEDLARQIMDMTTHPAARFQFLRIA
ncbi:hypothetical protein H7Q97_20180 [Ochrobactrum sp. CM-21-5]|nr:hypothetical protein [Ochrobactrum sp. CM-21-5]MBC2887699.1 hypothetical protein [Ochrobactrum sp. CM-21-5]